MNGFNWKWLVVGIVVGVGVMYIYAYAATAEARAKVAVLEETLEKQKDLTELAAQRADDAEALARLADEDLARVTAEEEARRQVLLQRISNRNATIAQLREDRTVVDRELAFLRMEIERIEPDEVAEQVQVFMTTEYPEFPAATFDLRFGNFFVANDPGARSILAGFTDAVGRGQQLVLADGEIVELNGKVDELNGMSTSLNTQLEFTLVDLERWKSAFEAKDIEAISLEDQINTSEEIISALKEKNFWEKIPMPVRASAMFAIGLAVGTQIK